MGLPQTSKVTVWRETLSQLAGVSIGGIISNLSKRKFVGQLVVNFNQRPASFVIREKSEVADPTSYITDEDIHETNPPLPGR